LVILKMSDDQPTVDTSEAAPAEAVEEPAAEVAEPASEEAAAEPAAEEAAEAPAAEETTDETSAETVAEPAAEAATAEETSAETVTEPAVENAPEETSAETVDPTTEESTDAVAETSAVTADESTIAETSADTVTAAAETSSNLDDVKFIDSDELLNTVSDASMNRERAELEAGTLNVVIENHDGTQETIVVKVRNELVKRPFIGGWRHKESKKEYHNCSAQTLPARYFVGDKDRNCRETQTVVNKNKIGQTTSDTSTQMTKTGCWVSDRQDKVIVPGKYVTADEKFDYMLRQVIILQSYFRRWKAQKYVNSIRQDHVRRIEWEKKEEERKRKEKERRLKEEYQRRMQPLSKEDFDLVYHALELWRREEIENINATKSGPERKAALAGLMDEETELIASIQRHKLIAKNDNGKRAKRIFLERCAAPKTWIGFDGMPTKMDTPYTMRAKDLKMIYDSLEKRYLTREERLDILLQLKLTVKEHDCKLTKDIVELIDREADLLMRGTKEKNLEGLRNRISTLFLQYIKTPLFNAEAARLLKVPEDPSSLRKNIYYCRGCGNYLPSTDFELTTNARSIGRCRKCKNLDSEGRLREDFSRYRSLLHSIRQTEESFNDNSRIIFLLTEADLRYLAENIWGAQSVLSQWEDTYDLTLVRWNRRAEWSPWNCVLLTNEEARAHSKLIKPEEAYGPVFTQKIKYRHILGKQYFSTLPKLGDYMNNNLESIKMPLPSNAEKVMFGGKSKPGTASAEKPLTLPPLTEAQ